MEEKNGKYIFGVVKMNEKGQIVIPRDARKVYDLKAGDTLMLVGDQNGMALIRTDVFQSIVGKVVEDIAR